MKNLIGFALLSLLFLAGCATPAATGPKVAGTYDGKWSGSDGMAGEFKIALTQGAGGVWNAKVGISYQGDSIPTTMKTIKVEGSKVETVYDFEAEGARSTVKMAGEVVGDVLAGTYEVSNARGRVTATGKWTSTRAK